ncbi:hypothetical protein [Nocardia carnea]|uniref:hypothetical protein n=1 Tax=Nocardia carnea TaxID=37328 RepID=UPI0002EB60D0|nr:hypothetical protein [Nocardia carnea]
MSSDEIRRRDAEEARRRQREASDRGRKSQDLGRWFHRGMAELRGETRANGWKHEQSVKLPSGRERKHDTARVNELGGRDFTEYKWGDRVGGELTMEQIAKEREFLRMDPNARGSWVMQRGAADSLVRKELEALVRDFPGRFRVEEVSKQKAIEARDLGKDLERNRNQLELIDSSKLRGQERARELREKAQQRQRTQEAVKQADEAREREQRERQELAERERKQREAAERLAENARLRREGERTPISAREAADMLRLSQPTPGQEAPHHRHPQPGQMRSSRTRGRERDRGLERGR